MSEWQLMSDVQPEAGDLVEIVRWVGDTAIHWQNTTYFINAAPWLKDHERGFVKEAGLEIRYLDATYGFPRMISGMPDTIWWRPVSATARP